MNQENKSHLLETYFVSHLNILVKIDRINSTQNIQKYQNKKYTFVDTTTDIFQ
jgi:hypothetical protein